jgi:hypothetical protein
MLCPWPVTTGSPWTTSCVGSGCRASSRPRSRTSSGIGTTSSPRSSTACGYWPTRQRRGGSTLEREDRAGLRTAGREPPLSLPAVPRPLRAALLLGLLNAVVALVALVALALVELATPDEFGWFAYAPADEVVVRDPRFPWHYVAVPVALVVTNALAVPVCLRRSLGRQAP